MSNVPSFLSNQFVFGKYEVVATDLLYVGLKTGKVVKYVKVTETPHYLFALKALLGNLVKEELWYLNYQEYVKNNPNSCDADYFYKLICSIKDNGYDYENSPVLVFRHWSRPFPFKRWDVADGFHRLAVLSALGEKKIEVLTLKYKQSFFERIFGKFI